MPLKIHAFPRSPRNFKPLLVADYLGLDYELCFCDFTIGAQRTEAYAAINPNRKAPALEHDEFKLWESNAIIQYLATLKPEAGLMPRDPRAQADVLRWMFWDTSTWDPACAILAFERLVKGAFGMGEPDPVEVEKGLAKLAAAAEVLDAHLKGRRFICGDDVTLADFAIASALTLWAPAQLPLEPYGEIRRWAGTMMALPAWERTQALQGAPAAA
jgi:glutathione S-transferase